LKHTVEYILLKSNKERHRIFHLCCAVLSTHAFFFVVCLILRWRVMSVEIPRVS
jgi:hypothetical protein